MTKTVCRIDLLGLKSDFFNGMTKIDNFIEQKRYLIFNKNTNLNGESCTCEKEKYDLDYMNN